MNTYKVIFRHPKGYLAHGKVRAADEDSAREIFTARKPKVQIVSIEKKP